MSLLGIDIGSSSCKAAIFDKKGNMLSCFSKAYQTYSPQSDMVEIKAEEIWQTTVKVINNVNKKIKEDTVEALAISSHGETFIPVDKNGNAIGPAIMNSDNRATKQSRWLEREIGKEKIYNITGLPVHPMYGINKILWLKENQNNLFSNADKFIGVEDYILRKMDLPPYTDYSLASRMMAFDIERKEWSDEILNLIGLTKDNFSIPLPSGKVIGKLSGSVAKILGLKKGTIVASGGHDQPCSALGSGAIYSNQLADSAGTYECLVASSDSPYNNSKALSYNLNSYCHVVPNKYVTLAFFPAGIVVKWFIEEFCHEEKLIAKEEDSNVYKILSSKIPDKSTGICITPHFIGSCNPYWDVRATGVIVGLTPQITKYQLYKAIFEGIACELAINIEILEDIVDKFKTIKISGGAASSPFTIQLRADITNKHFQTLSLTETVCRGAAMLAGIACGTYKSFNEAIRKIENIKENYTPNNNIMNDYSKQIKKYKLMYPALENIRSL